MGYLFSKWSILPDGTSANSNLKCRGSFSLGELSRLLRCRVKGDPDLNITGIGALDSATSGQLSFLVDSSYRHLVSGCRASALIVSSEFRTGIQSSHRQESLPGSG